MGKEHLWWMCINECWHMFNGISLMFTCMSTPPTIHTAEAHFFFCHRNNILLKSTGNSGNKSPSHSNLLVNIFSHFYADKTEISLLSVSYRFTFFMFVSIYRHTSLEYFYRISFLSSYILSLYTCVIYVS